MRAVGTPERSSLINRVHLERFSNGFSSHIKDEGAVMIYPAANSHSEPKIISIFQSFVSLPEAIALNPLIFL